MKKVDDNILQTTNPESDGTSPVDTEPNVSPEHEAVPDGIEPVAKETEDFDARTLPETDSADEEQQEKPSKTLQNVGGSDLVDSVPPVGLCSDDPENGDGKLIGSGDSRLFHGYAITRPGGRPDNQDNYMAYKTRLGYLFVVCDGMGGGPGGKTASSRACQKIVEIVNSPTLPGRVGKGVGDILDFALDFANYDLRQYVQSHPELTGMGTTCVLLLITKNKAFVKHAGDSRLYQIRGSRKVYRTTDHSLVQELLKRHALKDEEQARQSSQVNVITSALGISQLIPHKESAELPFKKGDRFLLSTDGLHGVLPEPELLDALSQHIVTKKRDNETEGLRHVMQGLANKLDSIGERRRDHYDNMTGIMIVMDEDSAMRPTIRQVVKDKLSKLKIFTKFLK